MLYLFVIHIVFELGTCKRRWTITYLLVFQSDRILLTFRYGLAARLLIWSINLAKTLLNCRLWPVCITIVCLLMKENLSDQYAKWPVPFIDRIQISLWHDGFLFGTLHSVFNTIRVLSFCQNSNKCPLPFNLPTISVWIFVGITSS